MKTLPKIVLTPFILAMLGQSVSAVTVAYYSFEEGAIGAVPSGIDPPPNAVVDSAGGDDNMNAFGVPNAPLYSATVPGSTVPQTGAANTRSLNFVSSDDVYASTGGPLMTTAFTNFTLEAYVNFSALAGFQTIVGRDDIGNPGQGDGPQSLLYFQKSNANVFRVELITNNNVNVQVNSTSVAELNTWYHLAAVGNASAGTLELFVNGASVGSSTATRVFSILIRIRSGPSAVASSMVAPVTS